MTILWVDETLPEEERNKQQMKADMKVSPISVPHS